MHIMLDLSSLRNAVAQLERALKDASTYPHIETVREGVIQCFEFTYEMCPKMLRRFFEINEAAALSAEDFSFANLIRLASDRGLVLNGWDRWSEYRQARNITSHTYDRAKADQVFAMAAPLLEDARYLLDRLTERLNA